MKQILIPILLLSLVGCVDPSPTQETGYEAVAITTFDSTDIYLLPAVDSRDQTLPLNDTTYDIIYEGQYLGKRDASTSEALRNMTINFSEANLTKTFVFAPTDDLDLLVSVKDLPYPTRMKERISDKHSHYIVPQIYVPTLNDFKYRVRNDWLEDPTKIGAEIDRYDRYDFEIEFTGNEEHQFDHICCVYDHYSLEEFEITTIMFDPVDYISWKRSPPECENEYMILLPKGEDLHFTLITDDYTDPFNFTCYFIDSVWTLNKDGEYSHEAITPHRKDAGLPNPSFTIQISKPEGEQ
jgi:hypothetical protein